MGISGGITKEKFLEYYPIPVTIRKTEIILEQMKKSICKIDDKKGKGTGFFCLIPFKQKKLKVLITNNHLIDEEILKNNKELIIKLNDDKEERTLILNEKRKMYTNKDFDTTIIELLPEQDDLENICIFLELDELVLKNNPSAKKKSIYITQYPNYTDIQKASVSYGTLHEVSNNSEIVHYCCTDKGSSGSPILSLENNKVLGIHKEAGKLEYNKGTFLKFPIEEYLQNKNIINSTNIERNLTTNEIYEIKYKKFIEEFKNNKFSKILFMIGGGINFSEESILFRNKTDYYKVLNQNINFRLSHFIKEPLYYYKFMKNLNLDKLEPNIYYKFMNFFVHKDIVKYIFTQNVDGLEIKAKIPEEKIVYVHGNALEGHCPLCKKSININKIKEGIKKEKVYYCPRCDTPCKPNIVFFEEELPKQFFKKIEECHDIDLIIVIGSYLTVTPFSNIPEITNKNAFKLLFNDENFENSKYNNLGKSSLLIQGENKKNIMKFLGDTNLLFDFLDFLKREYNEELN